MFEFSGRMLGYILAFSLSVALGSRLPSATASLLHGRFPPPITGEVITVGAVPVSGRLELTRVATAALPTDPWTSAIAVLITASAMQTCEDVGRQLRELRRESSARGVPMVIWTDEKSLQTVTMELHRERLSGIRVSAVRDLGLLASGESVTTPAVIHFDGEGRVITGVSYPESHPNVRPVPFAAEIWPSMN